MVFIKILTFYELWYYQILAVLENDIIYQNSDFLRELSLSTQTGAFLLVFFTPCFAITKTHKVR